MCVCSLEVVEKHVENIEQKDNSLGINNNNSHTNLDNINMSKRPSVNGKLSPEELSILSAKPCSEVDKGSLEWKDHPTEECPRCHKMNEVPYFFCECGARRIASYG
jgi:hypothetical protein